MGRSNFEADIRLRQKQRLSGRIKGKMAEIGMSQADLGQKLGGISQVAVSKKIRKCQFDAKDLFIIFDCLDFTVQEAGECMKWTGGR